jgi:hypothetical protein
MARRGSVLFAVWQRCVRQHLLLDFENGGIVHLSLFDAVLEPSSIWAAPNVCDPSSGSPPCGVSAGPRSRFLIADPANVIVGRLRQFSDRRQLNSPFDTIADEHT